MGTHPVFLPGESHGQRSLDACNPWGCKESDVTKRLSTHTHTHTHTHTFTHTFYAASGHLDPTIPGLSKDTGPISDLIASHSCQPASSQRPCHHTPSKRTTHLSPRQEAITEHIKKASARQAESSLLFPVIFVLNHLVLRSGLPAGQCAIFLLPFRSTLFL